MTSSIQIPGTEASIGERLGYALRYRNVSQTGLEKVAKLSKGYVSRMLHGERMRFSPDILARTAAALRISVLWLATGQGVMEGGPDVPPPLPPPPHPSSAALETALDYHDDKKWSPAAVAAARALAPEHGDIRPAQWAGILDRLEEAIAKVKLT
jgi:transcriptional regulator with XRE-family HTH domain